MAFVNVLQNASQNIVEKSQIYLTFVFFYDKYLQKLQLRVILNTPELYSGPIYAMGLTPECATLRFIAETSISKASAL